MKKAKYADKITDLVEKTLQDMGHSEDFTVWDNLDEEFSFTLEHDASGMRFNYDLAELYHTKEEEDVKVKDQYREHLKTRVAEFVDQTLERYSRRAEEEELEEEYDDDEYEDDDEYDDEYEDDDDEYEEDEEEEEGYDDLPDPFLEPAGGTTVEENRSIGKEEFDLIENSDIDAEMMEKLENAFRMGLKKEQLEEFIDGLDFGFFDLAGLCDSKRGSAALEEFLNSQSWRTNNFTDSAGIIPEMEVSGSINNPVLSPISENVRVVSSNDVLPAFLRHDGTPFCVFIEMPDNKEVGITAYIGRDVFDKVTSKFDREVDKENLLFTQVDEHTMIAMADMTPEYIQQMRKDMPFVKEDCPNEVYQFDAASGRLTETGVNLEEGMEDRE